MDSLKTKFLGTTIGSAMYARFIVPHYHSFFRVNGGPELRVELPDCELDGEFVADPFLFAWNGNVWMFFEGMRKGRGDRGVAKGVVGCMLYDNGAWSYQGIALEEAYHLSYPQVFEDGGVVYMIPESAQAGEVALYEAEDFPLKWRKKAVLIRGKYVDSSVLRKEGRWYLTTTPDDSVSRAELWHSVSLVGPWEKHPASDNVPSTLSLRRNGGAVFAEGDCTYRVAQDCEGGYGRRLFVIPIECVSANTYFEGTPILMSDALSWAQPGMCHTYNRARRGDLLFEVVDRHYNTVRAPIPFLIAVVWYVLDGIRYVFRSLFCSRKKEGNEEKGC